jgi:hypothetical protein
MNICSQPCLGAHVCSEYQTRTARSSASATKLPPGAVGKERDDSSTPLSPPTPPDFACATYATSTSRSNDVQRHAVNSRWFFPAISWRAQKCRYSFLEFRTMPKNVNRLNTRLINNNAPLKPWLRQKTWPLSQGSCLLPLETRWYNLSVSADGSRPSSCLRISRQR